MARVNLLNNQQFDNSVVTDNGTFILYQSSKIDSPNSDRGLEVVVTYFTPTPNPELGGTNFRFSLVLETEDNQGNWHPFHAQFESFVRPQFGNSETHILRLDPTIFNLDEGVINEVSNGLETVSRESRKQGVLPDDFRIKVLVSENGFGGTKPFQSINLSVSYLTYAI